MADRLLSISVPGPVTWGAVSIRDVRARLLADRHYSRQTIGAADFVPPGRRIALLTADAAAVWAVVENLDPRGGLHWRVSIFRNESQILSSCLVRAATLATYSVWRERYGSLPSVPLRTEVDPAKTAARRSKNAPPGRCFIEAGWISLGAIGRSHRHRGCVVLEAPPP